MGMKDDHHSSEYLAEELKQNKKEYKILFSSALTGGVGIGLFLLRSLVMSSFAENEQAQKVVVLFALALMAYAGIIVLTFIFARKTLSLVQFLLTWVAFPILFIKMLSMLG